MRYTRDDLGRITEARETNQGTTTTWTYSYDLLGQLTEVRLNGTQHATYTYDANSNRIGIVSPDQTIAAASIAFGRGQTNLYVYVGNDPINYVHPSGAAGIFAAVLAVITTYAAPALIGTGVAAGVHVGMLGWNSLVLRAVTPPQSAEQAAEVQRQIDGLEAGLSSQGSAFDRNYVLGNRAVAARDVFYSKNGHWDPAQACVSHYFTGKMYGSGNILEQYSMPVMVPLYSGAKVGSPLLVWAVSKDGMLSLELPLSPESPGLPWNWAKRGASDPSAYQEYWAFQGVRNGRR